MDKPDKQFWYNLGWGLVAVIIIIALFCNTIFPIQNGAPEYGVFNLVVCGAAGWFVYKKLKDSGGV